MPNRRKILVAAEYLGDADVLAYAVGQDAVVVGKTAVNTRTWVWTTKTTDAANPGQVGIDKTAWAGVVSINLNQQDSENADVSAFFGLRGQGDDIRLQLKTDSTRYGRYQITGPATDQGTWWRFPVVLLESSGNVPNGNAETLVSFLVNGIAIDIRENHT